MPRHHLERHSPETHLQPQSLALLPQCIMEWGPTPSLCPQRRLPCLPSFLFSPTPSSSKSRHDKAITQQTKLQLKLRCHGTCLRDSSILGTMQTRQTPSMLNQIFPHSHPFMLKPLPFTQTRPPPHTLTLSHQDIHMRPRHCPHATTWLHKSPTRIKDTHPLKPPISWWNYWIVAYRHTSRHCQESGLLVLGCLPPILALCWGHNTCTYPPYEYPPLSTTPTSADGPEHSKYEGPQCGELPMSSPSGGPLFLGRFLPLPPLHVHGHFCAHPWPPIYSVSINESLRSTYLEMRASCVSKMPILEWQSQMHLTSSISYITLTYYHGPSLPCCHSLQPILHPCTSNIIPTLLLPILHITRMYSAVVVGRFPPPPPLCVHGHFCAHPWPPIYSVSINESLRSTYLEILVGH